MAVRWLFTVTLCYFSSSVTGALCASPARASCCGSSCWGEFVRKGLGLGSWCKVLLLLGLLYLLWLVGTWWLTWNGGCDSETVSAWVASKQKLDLTFFLLHYCWNRFLCGAVILWDSVWNIPYTWKRAGCHRFLVSYVNFPFRQEAGLSNFPLTLETELKGLQKPIVNSVGDALPCSSLK